MSTTKQQLAIKALADGKSIKEASELSGLNPNYISTLKSKPEFAKLLSQACLDRLGGLLPDSISKLSEIIHADDTDLYNVQLQAVKTILDYSNISAFKEEAPEDLSVTIRYE